MAFISKLFGLLAPPVFKGDEEKTRIARMLNFILMIVMISLVCFSITAQFVNRDLLHILVELAIAVWTLATLVVLRRGRVREAAFLVSLTLWIVVSYGTWQAGGFRGSIMASYYGIVLIACLVLGTRIGAIFAALSIAFVGWVTYAEMSGILPPDDTASLPILWGEFSAVMAFVVAALGYITNDLRKALEITRQNEKELHRAAMRAQMLADKAEQANRFKDSLIRRISHELRTPLGVILPMAEMLRENYYGKLGESQNGAVNRIFSNATRLERLVEELLDQSQIEAGRLKLKLENFSPAEMAGALYLDCMALAQKQGIALNIQIDRNLPELIYGDPERTEEILRNLVVNAIKYTEKGRVDIRINRVDAEHRGFEVQDTGIGISKEAQAFIFDPFRQADETMTRRHGGVGLGLAIVHYLVVEAMHGTIDLVSQPRVGSTFTVVLPMQKADGGV